MKVCPVVSGAEVHNLGSLFVRCCWLYRYDATEMVSPSKTHGSKSRKKVICTIREKIRTGREGKSKSVAI